MHHSPAVVVKRGQDFCLWDTMYCVRGVIIGSYNQKL